MIVNVLISWLLQIGFTVGLILVFGFLIGFCNKLFYANFGSYGKLVCYVTGAIGTPVHEGAHVLFCLLFAHKITEIKLFQINSSDGTLGYVCHSYNKKNIYQKMGNFFIGVAPIIVISSLLYLFAYLLLPNFVAKINQGYDTFGFSTSYQKIFAYLYIVLRSFFLEASSWQWWVFVIISLFFALHMNLSRADIKGALSGIIFVLLLFLIVDIILACIKSSILNSFTTGMMKFGGYAICVFMLALIISLLALVVSFAFRFGKKYLTKMIKPHLGKIK